MEVEDINKQIPDSQPLVASNSARHLNILLIMLAAVIFLGLGILLGYLLWGNKNQQNSYQTTNQTKPSLKITPSVTVPTETQRIDPNMYNTGEELSGFPVYPNSLFIKKEKYLSCEEGKQSGFSICNAVAYTWQARDDYAQVSKWFSGDVSQSGWKCSGGAGSYGDPTSSSGVTTCSKNGVPRQLHLNSDSIKTEILLEVPLSEYKGKYF